MIVLDTNIVTYLLKRFPHVQRRYDLAVLNDTISLPAIAYFEISRWLLAPGYDKQRRLFEAWLAQHDVLPLDIAALDVAARIYDDLRRAGKLIEDADVLIAATALRHNALLVTHNTQHFSRIPGLRLEDWQAPEVS